MIVTLRQWAPPNTLFDQSLDHKLVGKTLTINISGKEIPGTIVVAKVRPDGWELEVTVELPDYDPTVASFARMVGTGVQHLGHGGAPQAYEALDELLERNIPQASLLRRKAARSTPASGPRTASPTPFRSAASPISPR